MIETFMIHRLANRHNRKEPMLTTGDRLPATSCSCTETSQHRAEESAKVCIFTTAAARQCLKHVVLPPAGVAELWEHEVIQSSPEPNFAELAGSADEWELPAQSFSCLTASAVI